MTHKYIIVSIYGIVRRKLKPMYALKFEKTAVRIAKIEFLSGFHIGGKSTFFRRNFMSKSIVYIE